MQRIRVTCDKHEIAFCPDMFITEDSIQCTVVRKLSEREIRLPGVATMLVILKFQRKQIVRFLTLFAAEVAKCVVFRF
jgi:hypothetical protein